MLCPAGVVGILSCAVVVGIHAGAWSGAHDVGGFVTVRGAASSSCIRTRAQPPNTTASVTTPVHARNTAARPHVRPHDCRSGWVAGSSADHASSRAASVGGGTNSVFASPAPYEVPAAVSGWSSASAVGDTTSFNTPLRWSPTVMAGFHDHQMTTWALSPPKHRVDVFVDPSLK